MLWYKSWLETRWRFLIGLVLLLCSAAATVLTYPEIQKFVAAAPSPKVSGLFADRIRESIELARDYRGFLWSHWFRQNLAQWGALFAVLLGTAGLLSGSGGVLFTLSLPFSRRRLLGVRAATGLIELLVLAFVPSLLLPLLSSSIQQRYGFADALVHSACFFVGVSLFFSIAFVLSAIFDDVWRPILIALAVAFLLALVDQVFNSPAFSVYRVMSAETYFRSGHVPWEGVLLAAAASTFLFYLAAAITARRDY